MIVYSVLVALMLQSGSPALRTLDAGTQASIDAARHVVIQNQAEWNTFWRTHSPNRPAPPVDFAKEMVVGVFLGSRPTAGYSVEIRSAQAEDGALVVRYSERRPPGDVMTAQMITSPFQIVAVPKVPGVASFLADPK